MPQAKQELRSRIRSVASTRKITSAMEMIANAKLLKNRKQMENNREYAGMLQDTVFQIVTQNPEVENIYLKEKKSTCRLTIVFASDLGLCGSYNANVLKLAQQILKPEDPMIVVGTQLYRQLKEAGFNLMQKTAISSDSSSFLTLKEVVQDAVDMYLKDEVAGIQLLYTRFINTMTFRPEMDTLLPCILKHPQEETSENYAETLFEPDPDTILSRLIPMMIENVTYSDWLEAKTAEQGNRRVAMKLATDNADSLTETLKLEYNKLRQSSITQEITEIVSGSSAV